MIFIRRRKKGKTLRQLPDLENRGGLEPIEQSKVLVESLLLISVNDYLAYVEGTPEQVDAKGWIFSEEIRDDNGKDIVKNGITFISSCTLLRLNPEKLRFLINCKRDEGKRRMRDIEFSNFLEVCSLSLEAEEE